MGQVNDDQLAALEGPGTTGGDDDELQGQSASGYGIVGLEEPALDAK